MIHLQEEVVGHPNRVDYILIDVKACKMTTLQLTVVENTSELKSK